MKQLVSIALVCTAQILMAQTVSPWNGSWKLDRAKSHLSGTSYTMSKGPDGIWTNSAGNLSYTFAPDGKPYPMFDKDHTIMVTFPNPHTMKTVVQFKGKTTDAGTDVLSQDGNTIVESAFHTRQNGPTYKSTETDKRVGSGEGFLGTWMSEKVDTTSDSPKTIKYSGESVTFSTPARKTSLTAKLDGTPATPAGHDFPAGTTVSYKKALEARLEWTSMLNGKVVEQGYDELAADGRSFTETSWLIGAESEKSVGFFNKL
jgi:hypothetical protein